MLILIRLEAKLQLLAKQNPLIQDVMSINADVMLIKLTFDGVPVDISFQQVYLLFLD